jgi:bifunctional DNA-binding transcriptional regulator/antitoxin component of YhaV-PrlF toxin-antitoxin module
VPKTKVQGQVTRRKNKEYTKYIIVMPSKIIDQLQWTKGDQLIPTVDGNVLRIKKASHPTKVNRKNHLTPT